MKSNKLPSVAAESRSAAAKILKVNRKKAADKVAPTKNASEKITPKKIVPKNLGDYLDVMTKAVFQAGVSWASVENKWDDFRQAFAQFDPAIVAKYKKKDIARLLGTPNLIRSERKIVGTIANAQTILELDAAHGSFLNYLRAFNSYDELSIDIQNRFNFVGEMSVYYFLFRVSERVPPFERWVKTIKGEHPRMREMIEHAADNSNH